MAEDQRGVQRPQNTDCDIGAFEVNECADGINNDGDAFTDLDDPGCQDATSVRENPQCQDGINNDPGQDPDPGMIDFDGGLSALGYVASDPDPQCVGLGWKNKERTGCGLGGFELALVLPGRMWLHRRRRRLHQRACSRARIRCARRPAPCGTVPTLLTVADWLPRGAKRRWRGDLREWDCNPAPDSGRVAGKLLYTRALWRITSIRETRQSAFLGKNSRWMGLRDRHELLLLPERTGERSGNLTHHRHVAPIRMVAW
jgi:hypothetical protein